MRQFKVKVIGVTPYMQHRMDDLKLEAWVKDRGPIYEKYDISNPEVIADFHSHTVRESVDRLSYHIPSDHFRMSMIEAGKMVKGKVGGSMKSMANVVAGLFSVTPERIHIPKWDTFDKRSAVNRNIKGRVIVIRPRWNEWKAEFTLTVDEDSITIETIQSIIEKSGKYIGIGSYRPQNKGQFGRYQIESLTVL